MESDTDYGMKRKYTAVRVGTLRYYPTSFAFVAGAEPREYFLVIDSKQATITVNVEQIDQFIEDPDTGRLQLVYHVQSDGKMVQKKDEYECAESSGLLKTFSGIRNKTVGLGLIEDAQFTSISGGRVTRRSTLPPKAAALDLGGGDAEAEGENDGKEGEKE